ncbi:MAG TPA: DUF4149 domain-containing protein [Methylophaga aminisulfidivorans]|uniref:DUF4149 domain-containing protein n=1 Tax=Methylophaga aminisulfidivorans TaxID=230105 RepID=A0A7C1VXH6_9GAMM|nr:DUF4149 domain-containing protein [Methylophaga aminisulfidivorans]
MIASYTGERLILTLWVGALWAIGYLAVPIAFANLDTIIAGDYAGKLFFAVNILSLISATILIVSRLFTFGIRHFHRYWRSWLMLIMLVMSFIFLAYLEPQMASIKALDWRNNTVLMERFDVLHHLSESIYMLMSLLGLMLVLTTDKRSEAEQVN